MKTNKTCFRVYIDLNCFVLILYFVRHTNKHEPFLIGNLKTTRYPQYTQKIGSLALSFTIFPHSKKNENGKPLTSATIFHSRFLLTNSYT